jgi:integrase
MAGRSTFGHVRPLPSGRFQVVYKVEGQRQIGPGTFPTKADADAYLARMQTEIRTGEWVDPRAGSTTLREYAEKWRASQVHRASTSAQVESHLRIHVYPRIGDKALAKVTKTDIQTMVKYLSEGGDRGKPLAPATVKVIYTWVATVFASAVDDRILPRSPCINIRLPRIEKRKVEPLPVDTVWKLIDGMPDRYRALVVLDAGTGVRISEGLGLTNDRVDWLRRMVKIDRQLMRTGSHGEPVFGPVKDKHNRPRTIPLPDFVVDELAAHVKQFEISTSGLIFTGPKGGPLGRTTFSDNWRAVAEPLGIPTGDGFHQLRHFYASLLIHNGLSVKAIQEYLGHHSAVLTLDTYGHLWPDGDDLTRTAVDNAFKSLGARGEHGGSAAP